MEISSESPSPQGVYQTQQQQQQQIHQQYQQQPQPPQPPQPQQPPQEHQSATAAAAAADTAVVNKLTRGHSCVLCQQRKVRCDKNKPCANCVKAQVECRVVPPQPPRRRKKKPQERELVERLRKYEALLSQYGVPYDALGGGGSSGGHLRTHDDVDELQNDLVGLKTSPSSSSAAAASAPGWNAFKDYRSDDDGGDDDDDDGSSDDGLGVDGTATIHHAFDGMFEQQDGFPFVIGGQTTKVTELHPPGIQIFQLWQIYLTNVNPLLKVTHTPTLQAQIIEAGANVARIPRALEALMFAVYFSAVTSMSEADVQSTFDEDRTRLLARFHRATQQALINAGFMRSPDLVVLQAFFLYLVRSLHALLVTFFFFSFLFLYPIIPPPRRKSHILNSHLDLRSPLR